MSQAEMTLNEIRERGYAALVRELGPVGYVRFIQQFETGKGDFTKERQAWAESLTTDQLTNMLLQTQKSKSLP